MKLKTMTPYQREAAIALVAGSTAAKLTLELDDVVEALENDTKLADELKAESDQAQAAKPGKQLRATARAAFRKTRRGAK